MVSIPDRDFGKFQLLEDVVGEELLQVSIPDRDFGKFQHFMTNFCILLTNNVSIPDRDFGKFQRTLSNSRKEKVLFQSLIGILVSFNQATGWGISDIRKFQSLIGILVSFNFFCLLVKF